MHSPLRQLLPSRLALIGSCIFVFIATVAGLCGKNTVGCFAVIGVDGVVALLWLCSACALGSLVLRRFKLTSNHSLHIATAGGLGLGIFSLLGLGLGLLGWLSHAVAVGFVLVPLVLISADLLRRHPGQLDRGPIKIWLLEPAGCSRLILIPVVSLAIVCVSASIMPGILWKPLDPHPYDVTSYHLLVPREWYEAGRIVPLSHNVFSYFPFNVEMQFLLLMHLMGGPWAGMYACQFISAGYAGLMVAAVGGAGEGRKGECSTLAFASSLIASAFAAVVPWGIMLAGVAYVETGLMLYTALAIAWALYAVRRPDHFFKSLVLAGMMTGFACGAKITAVPMLMLAVPTAVILTLCFRRPAAFTIKRILVGCVGFSIASLVVLSPWLIRNTAWSGNPLFPVGMSVLGKGQFTPQQVERFRIAHSPTAGQKTLASKLNLLWNDGIAHWQYGFVFFPVVLGAIALGWRDRQMWLILICGLFVLVVWIGFTHLLPRFLVMLIPIGGIAIGKIRWGRMWSAGVLLAIVAAGIGWAWVIPELVKQSNPPPMHGEARYAMMGLEDLTAIMPQDLIDARDRHLQIGMIGDAEAFLYQIPMKQMHYRSVFDVVGDDPIDAWVGPQVRGNPDWLLDINPMEIDRLHRTYVGVPALPPEWAVHEPNAFFMSGSEFHKP